MSEVPDFKRNEKHIDRMRNAQRLSARRSAILLPSREGLDVRYLLEAGVLTPDTKQWWVERDAEIAAGLPRLRDDLRLRHVEIICGNLEDFLPPQPVDYVNADLMGVLGVRTGMWLSAMASAGKFLEGATLVTTLTDHWRYSPFSDWMVEVLGVPREDHPMLGDLAQKAASLMEVLAINDVRRVMPRVLLSCALSSADFVWFRNGLYNFRGSPWTMTTMRIDDIRPRRKAAVWPSFAALADAFAEENVRPNLKSEFIELRDYLRSRHRLELLPDDAEGFAVHVPETGALLREFGTLPGVRAMFRRS